MKIYIFAPVGVILISFAGCTSTAVNQNPAANIVVNTTANTVNATREHQASNTPPAKTLDEMEKINRQAFNAAPKSTVQNTPVQNKSKTEDTIASRPAPENSSISSTMNEKGQAVEVRTFKDNPQLIKIERIYISDTQKMIKIYLKNKKIVEVKDDRIGDFVTASVSEILNAAQSRNKN